MHFCQVSLLDFYLFIAFSISIFLSFTISVIYLLRKKDLSIYLVENDEQCERACKEILKGKISVLGFDAEWVTIKNTRQPVALVQLCNENKICALFRLNLIKKVPPSLEEILEDPGILKVGVGIETDVNLLLNDYKILVSDTLDLRYIAPYKGGLAGISEKVLNIPLNKNYEVRCGNWEAEELTETQIHYAAMGAYVGVQIFKKCAKNCEWSQFINQPYARKLINSQQRTLKKRGANSYSKKGHVYDNCIMLAPNNVLLCTTSKS